MIVARNNITCKKCKGTGKIIKKVSMNITHYGACPQCLGEGGWLILDQKEVSKVENVKVIRKLEDFDGLENGMGLRFEILRECYNGDIYDFLILTTEEKEFQRWNLKYQKHLISCFVFFKAMGFKFEYRPLRTKEEVFEEMELASSKLSDVKKFAVGYLPTSAMYYTYKKEHAETLGTWFFDKETAQKYADELNEIIKNS